MRSIHDNFDFSVSRVKLKYKINNKIHWLDIATFQFTLKIKIGEIKKKKDPIREYGIELVNVFKILNEKYNCK